MAEPSIKGSIFKGAIDDLARLREEGRIPEDGIDSLLTIEDLDLLEGEISPAAWYPIESYARLMRLLGDVEGDGKDAYFIERGRASARRLMASGLYQQLAYLSRWESVADRDQSDHSASVESYARNLRMVISLAAAIYNVGKWVVEPDSEHEGRVNIAVREASDYSEPMRLAIEGFLNECSRSNREGLAHLYVSERRAPDLMLFRMTRDIADLAKG